MPISTLSMIPASDAGLVGYWRGDSCPCDLTKQNPGIATREVTYAPAMAGNGFRFNGRDDSIRIPDTTTLMLTGSLTISGWINVESYPTEAEHMGLILFRGDDRAGLDPYKLGVGSDNRLMFHIGSMKSETEITAPIANRRFVLVTATLDAATGKMRLDENAVLVAETVTVARPPGALDPTQNPSIGIGNCNAIPDSRFRYPFHGIINDLRLYSRPLAQSEIRSLFAASLQVTGEIKPASQEPAGHSSNRSAMFTTLRQATR